VGLAFLLLTCRPIEANWTMAPGSGDCLGIYWYTLLSKIASIVNVLADLGVAIIPMFLLRKVQMQTKLKVLTGMVLGLGILLVIEPLCRRKPR
jgi:hypothetical protein